MSLAVFPIVPYIQPAVTQSVDLVVSYSVSSTLIHAFIHSFIQSFVHTKIKTSCPALLEQLWNTCRFQGGKHACRQVLGNVVIRLALPISEILKKRSDLLRASSSSC